MNNVELAWLAGIMEGEGTFSIYHQKRKGADSDQLRATVSLTNTDPYLINKAFSIFQSIGVEMHIHEYDNKKGSTRTVYDMQTSKHTNVKVICEKLLPYLFGEKSAKAKMLLRFVTKRLEKLGPDNNTRGGKYDEEDWEQFNSFRSSTTTREAATSVA
jgi:hypothetical protein